MESKATPLCGVVVYFGHICVGVGLLTIAFFLYRESSFWELGGAEILRAQFGDVASESIGSEAVALQIVSMRCNGDTVYVAGQSPGIYWYSDLRAPTRFIYEANALDLVPGARSEVEGIISGLERGVVVVPPRASQLMRAFLAEQGWKVFEAVGDYQIFRKALSSPCP